MDSIADLGYADTTVECGNCGGVHPSWAMYNHENYTSPICGICVNRENELEVPEVEVAFVEPWDTEKGKYLKAERLSKLNDTAWVYLPGCPYTDSTVEQFTVYRSKLHRMTVDYQPDTWEWPETPVIEYKEF